MLRAKHIGLRLIPNAFYIMGLTYLDFQAGMRGPGSSYSDGDREGVRLQCYGGVAKQWYRGGRAMAYIRWKTCRWWQSILARYLDVGVVHTKIQVVRQVSRVVRCAPILRPTDFPLIHLRRRLHTLDLTPHSIVWNNEVNYRLHHWQVMAPSIFHPVFQKKT